MVPAAGVGGKAVFTFNAPAEGDYIFWGRVVAPTDSNNSFHWSVDTELIDNDATEKLIAHPTIRAVTLTGSAVLIAAVGITVRRSWQGGMGVRCCHAGAGREGCSPLG